MYTSFRIFLRAAKQWSENRDSRAGAALAYYTLFSIAPILLLAINVASMIFSEQEARDQVVIQVRRNVDPESADAILTLLENVRRPSGGRVATSIGIAFLVVGSLSVFLHLRDTLCSIWKLEPMVGNTVLSVLLDYALALVMVLACGLLLLASLAVTTMVSFISDFFADLLPEQIMRWRLIELGISFVFLTILFAAMFRILSGGRVPLGYVLYGSLIASVLFNIGKALMGLYLANFSPASAYGAAGSLVGFMLWIYYSSQMLFFCAELIQARRTRHDWLNADKPKPATNT